MNNKDRRKEHIKRLGQGPSGGSPEAQAEDDREENLFILNRDFRVFANVIIIAIYLVIFFMVKGPWVMAICVVGFALLIRSATLFAMSHGSEMRLSQRVVLPLVNLFLGGVIFGIIIGALYLVGASFLPAQPVVKILVNVLMAVVAFKSTLPLGDLTAQRTGNL